MDMEREIMADLEELRGMVGWLWLELFDLVILLISKGVARPAGRIQNFGVVPFLGQR